MIRVIARDIDLKIDLFDRKDSYQELGDLLEKSMMIFVVLTIILSTLIYGMYYSKIITFNFGNIHDFLVTIFLILFIFGVFSWLWLSSLIDLKDKYQRVKRDYLTSFKIQLEQLETKLEKNSDDIIRMNKLLFQINHILSKPSWPLERPILLTILPLMSPALAIIAIIRQIGGV